ncbi:MAG: PHP-associated domain-containing protein, partial [Dehalococcoidales bacterium]|nr:PHP-associated domain-containing protein [Dehalococcoidales bacterium]
NSPYLNALELTISGNRVQWENGAMRGYTKKYACVQGSDAHSPAEVGRRPTYLRMAELNLASLKAVFQHWQGNIAFTREE